MPQESQPLRRKPKPETPRGRRLRPRDQQEVEEGSEEERSLPRGITLPATPRKIASLPDQPELEPREELEFKETHLPIRLV